MKDETINVKEVLFKTALLTIEGKSPLMSNKFKNQSFIQMQNKQNGKIKNAGKKGREVRNPEQEFKESLHVIDGKKEIYGIPSIAIKKAMVKTAGRLYGEVMTELRASFSIPQELLEIRGPKPVMDERIGYIGGRNKVANPVYRARFDKWEIDVPIRYISTTSLERLVNYLHTAGQTLGIMSYRLENDGTHGEFIVKQIKKEDV